MTAPFRVFFAHPKSMDDAEIDAWQHDIGVLFEAEGYGSVEIIPGRDDFHRYAVGAGSFGAWARDVARRRDMSTGRPYYSAFVSPNVYVGRATADIIGGALHAKTPVIYMEQTDEGTQNVYAVRGVVVVDADDYVKGWFLDT